MEKSSGVALVPFTFTLSTNTAFGHFFILILFNFGSFESGSVIACEGSFKFDGFGFRSFTRTWT